MKLHHDGARLSKCGPMTGSYFDLIGPVWEIAMSSSTPLNAETMQNHWMPFTANRDFARDPKIFAKAEGVYYYDHEGRKILDGSSGLFTTPAGHGRREIAEAVYKQLTELDFTPSFLRSHEKTFELASKIAAYMPEGLDKIFFVNSGSEAVDTAMKMALNYHRVRGQGNRQMFVSRERAYHGVNFGGVALSGMVNNRRAFGNSLPNAVHMRHTHIPENKFQIGEGDHGVDLAEDLTRIIANYGGENIAAVFVEPIAGSTGTLVPPKGYLKRLRELCTQNGILLVFDEVITGFGRTGRSFASHSFNVKPDIITMAKAITNGAQPMAAVAASLDVHDTIVNAAPENATEFFHGYTWSAHPAACAASLATLKIYEDERLFERAAQMSVLAERCAHCHRYSRLRHDGRCRRGAHGWSGRAGLSMAKAHVRIGPSYQDDWRCRCRRPAIRYGDGPY
jgi:beta-alanine--pyruvate transaminase